MSIFGGNTGLTYEDVQRKRAIASRLIAGQSSAPRNVGEGLTAIGNALAARSLNKQSDARAAELNNQWSENAGGLGIDAARMEIIKNLPYEQRQMYVLNHMDRQDALSRRGSGGAGTGKADAQAALVAQLLGDTSGPAAQPSMGGFEMGEAITGQTPMAMPDFQPQAPVEQAPMMDEFAPVAQPSAAPMQQPMPSAPAPMAMPEQATPGLSYNLPPQAQAQEPGPGDAIAKAVDKINDLSAGYRNAKSAEQQKAYASALKFEQDNLAFLKDQVADKPSELDALRLRQAQLDFDQDSTNAPDTKTLTRADGSEVAAQWDRKTQTWVPIEAPAGGGNLDANQDLSEGQSKLTLFQSNMAATSPFLLKMEEQYNPANMGDAAASAVPIGGNFLKTQDGQQYHAAATMWAEGALRIATGAAAQQDEIKRNVQTYFAQPGDYPATIMFKQSLRKAYETSIRRALGDNVPVEQLPSPQEFAQQNGAPTEVATDIPDVVGGGDIDEALRILDGVGN